MERTFQVSVGDLATELTRTRANGGNLPHLTGNLMRSLLASTAAMPKIGASGQIYAGVDAGVVAASITLEDTVYLGYQAAYARRMNYGFIGADSLGRQYNQAGAYFVERARDMWPQIVNNAANKVRGPQ